MFMADTVNTHAFTLHIQALNTNVINDVCPE